MAFANDGSFMEQFLKLQQQKQGQDGAETAEASPHLEQIPAEPTPAGSAEEHEAEPQAQQQAPSSSHDNGDAEFVPSPTFAGARPGYCFTTGEHGTGYYADVPLKDRHRKQQEAARAKPVVLKSKSIVSIQPRKLASAPDAKKRKLADGAAAQTSGYLAEMARYQAMSCGSDTKHDRPLVK